MRTKRRSRQIATLRVQRITKPVSRFIFASIGVLVAVIFLAVWMQMHAYSAMPATTTTPNNTTTSQALPVGQTIQERFTTLSQAHSDACSHLGDQPAIAAEMAAMPQGSYLQGSCCSPMDLKHYEQQIAALKTYANISQLPQDPYNLPVTHAITLMNYDQSIQLLADQQTVYNQAASKTKDNGWCCCQCWAWYAHSGLAKYSITTQHFSAAQVVTITNAEDCCGGA